MIAMTREAFHRKVLRDFPGRDVAINYVTYYWVDGEHKNIGLLDLIATGVTKREAVKRFNHRIAVVQND